MTKRTTMLAFLASAVVVLPVLFVAYSTLGARSFLVVVAVFMLALGLLEPLAFKPRRRSRAEVESRLGNRGETAVVLEELIPEGKVRLGAEIWTARSMTGSAIAAGREVRVRAAKGLTLLVEPQRKYDNAI